MRTVTRTRVGFAVALVLGLVIGAFLSVVLRSTDVFDPPRRTTTARDVEHAEQVLFASDRGFPSVRTVLRSRADVTQFAGRFFDEDTADDITETLAARDFAAEALIAFAWGAGCAPGDGAKLTTTGNADYSVRLTGADHPPEECAAPWEILAVFALPKAEVPPETRLGGMRPDPPGPAGLAHFAAVSDQPARGMEVSQPDQLAAFLTGFEPVAADRVRSAVRDRATADRAFAFVLLGCHNDGAYLVLSPARMEPVLTATEPVVCVKPDHYVAVFTVPAESVPAGATIG
ncbi:hypothetical protein NN3_48550 [Nocardia neocaledoniensis NBRC 108232]|uniref:Uncharacterized protein n=1 Tax=Nocardia neocaledoniensis TaxID=236511 RepID=A0A317NAF2_9NOCA|nr:hypothetical protein [Nocardia neocaledoniensis]PWV72099.1 hypothetical protein DFR69_10914 [Nocardia neocaledoniensis]GEM33848.1 hypothetical protein NN3_48550 [Nocardia neocaledoniensis NBRC 108232]